MFDIKKHTNALEAGQRRRAELNKGIEKLRQEYERLYNESAKLQAQRAAIIKGRDEYQKGGANMTEGQYIEGRIEIERLSTRILRLNPQVTAAKAALDAAEDGARGELAHLRSMALDGWKKELYEANREMERAWIVL
jgi:predicted  nucleic acid-binding Zn-ribbon protein